MNMLFRKILVAVDGSAYSQLASEYAFSLARESGVTVDGQHVLDPRMVNLFVAREFAEELGFSQSVETTDKVFNALKRISTVILDLFKKEAKKHGFDAQTFLDIGYLVEEINKRANDYDLIVMGHSSGDIKAACDSITGSVAERVACEADKPVLIALKPLDAVKSILVGYDGSEPAKGALLMAEQLAKFLNKPLKALTVSPEDNRMAEARLTAEQGADYLRENHTQQVFDVQVGDSASKSLLQYAEVNNSLLVIGAYGFNIQEKATLGSTATNAVRRTRSSILVFR